MVILVSVWVLSDVYGFSFVLSDVSGFSFVLSDISLVSVSGARVLRAAGQDLTVPP